MAGIASASAALNGGGIGSRRELPTIPNVTHNPNPELVSQPRVASMGPAQTIYSCPLHA